MVSDNPAFAHGARRRVFLPSDVHAGSHIAAQFGIAVNQPGDSFCLIICQGIHRIDKQRLNATLSAMPVAVLKNWIQEALGFAGPCAGRD